MEEEKNINDRNKSSQIKCLQSERNVSSFSSKLESHSELKGERPKVCPMGFHLLKGNKVIQKSSEELKLVNAEPSLIKSFNNFEKVDVDFNPADPKLVEAA